MILRAGSTQKQKSNSLGRKITLTDAYAAMPLEARMYQKNSTELRPAPRKADAPLEERLYPNKQDARTGIEYPHWAKNISSELPLPPHEGSYYRIAKRPLDMGIGAPLYKLSKKVAHEQLVRNDGNNFGFFLIQKYEPIPPNL